MREALPSDLIATTLSEVGKQFSEAPRTPQRSKPTPTQRATRFAPALRVSRMAEIGTSKFDGAGAELAV
jgi:hypothetical protein